MVAFLKFQLYFSHFIRSVWKMVYRKNSLNYSSGSSDYDLLIKSFNEKFRATVSSQITCMEIFWRWDCNFSHCKRRFWKIVRRKNSGKSFNCSFEDWALLRWIQGPIECLNRLYRDLFDIGVAIFCTLDVVSGEWCGGKSCEKILVALLTKNYRLSRIMVNVVP